MDADAIDLRDSDEEMGDPRDVEGYEECEVGAPPLGESARAGGGGAQVGPGGCCSPRHRVPLAGATSLVVHYAPRARPGAHIPITAVSRQRHPAYLELWHTMSWRAMQYPPGPVIQLTNAL